MIEFSIYFADCKSACLPLQDCPHLNEIALKIQQLGNQDVAGKLELLNLIYDKLCGGRINKDLYVCCSTPQLDNVNIESSSASDNNKRGYGL